LPTPTVSSNDRNPVIAPNNVIGPVPVDREDSFTRSKTEMGVLIAPLYITVDDPIFGASGFDEGRLTAVLSADSSQTSSATIRRSISAMLLTTASVSGRLIAIRPVRSSIDAISFLTANAQVAAAPAPAPTPPSPSTESKAFEYDPANLTGVYAVFGAGFGGQRHKYIEIEFKFAGTTYSNAFYLQKEVAVSISKIRRKTSKEPTISLRSLEGTIAWKKSSHLQEQG
jgi:hypothetical protein